jgi:hypothetical protein
MPSENSTPEQAPTRGRAFSKGISGNPGGRPKRLRDLEEAIREKHVGEPVLAVLDKLQAMATEGDVAAAKLYLERVVGPPRVKEDPVEPKSTGEPSSLLCEASRVARDHVRAISERAAAIGISDTDGALLASYVRAGTAVKEAYDEVFKGDLTPEQLQKFLMEMFETNEDVRQMVVDHIRSLDED